MTSCIDVLIKYCPGLKTLTIENLKLLRGLLSIYFLRWKRGSNKIHVLDLCSNRYTNQNIICFCRCNLLLKAVMSSSDARMNVLIDRSLPEKNFKVMKDKV